MSRPGGARKSRGPGRRRHHHEQEPPSLGHSSVKPSASALGRRSSRDSGWEIGDDEVADRSPASRSSTSPREGRLRSRAMRTQFNTVHIASRKAPSPSPLAIDLVSPIRLVVHESHKVSSTPAGLRARVRPRPRALPEEPSTSAPEGSILLRSPCSHAVLGMSPATDRSTVPLVQGDQRVPSRESATARMPWPRGSTPLPAAPAPSTAHDVHRSVGLERSGPNGLRRSTLCRDLRASVAT